MSNFTPPPIRSAAGSQRWQDWYSKLDDFINNPGFELIDKYDVVDQGSVSSISLDLSKSPDTYDLILWSGLGTTSTSSILPDFTLTNAVGVERNGASSYTGRFHGAHQGSHLAVNYSAIPMYEENLYAGSPGASYRWAGFCFLFEAGDNQTLTKFWIGGHTGTSFLPYVCYGAGMCNSGPEIHESITVYLGAATITTGHVAVYKINRV